MRGRPCTVCSHDKRREIDQHLAAGDAIKSVAIKYGLSNGSVGRHKLNCCSFPAQAKSDAEPVIAGVTGGERADESLPTKDVLGAMILTIHSRLDEIAKQCHDEGANALAISAIDKMRLSIESFARLQGMTGSGSKQSISVNVGVAVTAGEIVSALRAPVQVLDLEALEELSADA